MPLDKTTDWEAVFEDPETGLIHMIMLAESPQSLKKMAHVIIRKLYVRKDEDENIEKLFASLNDIIPENALTNDLARMQAGVRKLLRQIKKDRKKKAAEYRVSQYEKRDSDRRVAGARRMQQMPFWKTRPTMRQASAIVAVVVVIAAAVAIFVQNPTNSRMKDAQGRAAVQWVENFVSGHLPMTSLRLGSVAIAGDSVIEMEITVSKTHDAKLYDALRAKSQSARQGILQVVCPPPKSGVSYFLDRGWTLRVVFKGQNEKLIDGVCQYQPARSWLDSPQLESTLTAALGH